jgi:CubicO group peptidase (beta-lactamase class C family)
MKTKYKKHVSVLLGLILAVAFPLSAFAGKDNDLPIFTVAENIASTVSADKDTIMSFYEQHKEYAASLAVAMINQGDTELYYLGDNENNPDYVYDWGSCTKVITWVSVMQLVEQGKIDLNADIRLYLPKGFLTRLKYDEPITMLNLMNHNAGFQDLSGELFEADKTKIPTLSEVLKVNQPPQISKPGEVVAYSNYGSALAGYVVECVSGMDYGDYVIRNIFTPLGMLHTAIKPDRSDNQWVDDQWSKEKCYLIFFNGDRYELGGSEFPMNPLVYGIYGPAGSACGTLEDFTKFVMALIPDENKKCLLFEKDSTLSEMYEPTLYYSDGTPRNAHGMWIELLGNGLFGHGGNSVGFSSSFSIDPVDKKAIVVMTNVADEIVYNHKFPRAFFGDYDWSDSELSVYKDISGNYIGMRGYSPHGFLKITRFLDSIRIVKTEQNNVFYFDGNEDFAITQITNSVYVMNFDDLNTYFFLDENGVLHYGADELHRRNVVEYGIDWALYYLCFLSFFFAVTVLVVKGSIFVVKKIRKREIKKTLKQKSHLFSLGCSAAVVLLLLVSVNFDVSNATIAVFGVLGTLSAAVAFVLGILQVNIKDASQYTKTLRVLTLLASLIMLTNVLYWEFFNFWSV